VTALVWLVVLIAAVGIKSWAGFRLMYGYRPPAYLATPDARRLYRTNLVATIFIPIPIVAASYESGVWWVEAAAWLLFTFCAAKIAWAIHMRTSGKYVEYYRRHQWE
jgi:hypothetical protein